MKKLLIVTLLIFISCGPSEEEIQSQIDEAVEKALDTTTTSTTTTTLAPTTTTSTTTTTLAPTTTTSTTTTTTTTTIPQIGSNCLEKSPNQSRYAPEILKIEPSKQEFGMDEQLSIRVLLKKGTYDIIYFSIVAVDEFGRSNQIASSFQSDDTFPENQDGEFWFTSTGSIFNGRERFNPGKIYIMDASVTDQNSGSTNYRTINGNKYVFTTPDVGCPEVQTLFDPDEVFITLIDN